jgi:hypothetical protein
MKNMPLAASADELIRLEAHMHALLARSAEIEGQIQESGPARNGVIDDTAIIKEAEVVESGPHRP